MTRSHQLFIPRPEFEELQAALSACADVRGAMVVHSKEGPTIFRPGVLTVLLHDGTPESSVEEIVQVAKRALGRSAADVPVVCGVEGSEALEPYAKSGGAVLVHVRSK